jgi:hypothetical protein
LHEKDLDESKGGTKGFDATRANRELEDAQRKFREERDQKSKKSNDDDENGGDASMSDD